MISKIDEALGQLSIRQKAAEMLLVAVTTVKDTVFQSLSLKFKVT